MKSPTAYSVIRKLKQIYSHPRTFLHYRTSLDILIATVLSARCTDVCVNRVVKRVLYPKYSTPYDYVSVSRKELECDIRPCGSYRKKAGYIQSLCTVLISRHAGNVPHSIDELIKLPGVGKKTAAIVSFVVTGNAKAVAVDTHVMRLARRLGLSAHSSPDKISLDLMRSLPKPLWGDVTALLISHGRAVCTARRRKCHLCVFRRNCPSSNARKPEK